MMAARSTPHATPVVDPHLERLAAEVAHMATKQHDYATVLQAVQIDLQHLVKTMDKLASVAGEQVQLAAKISSLGESMDRAYRTMDGHKDGLERAINKLSETLDRDRDSAKTIGETVNGYKAQLRLMYIVGGVIISLLVALATMTTNGINGRYLMNREAIAKNANDIEVLEAKWERLRISDQLIVNELERRLSRIESLGDEVAP